jgi:aspartate-semialdehyde dehydrogenase
MTQKTTDGILGATGAVGQNYVRLLENHPWFEIGYLAASPQSAGKPYAEACGKKWVEGEMPKLFADSTVYDANRIEQCLGKCDMVFSAIEGDKDYIRALEIAYAQAGIPVVSNNSAHRWTADVPMLIPEINPEHLEIINAQKKNYGFDKGFVVVKPNCSLQSYVMQLHALREAGYRPEKVIVVTQQASSGAGYPGVPSLDLIDNTIPYISGEEEKSEQEPLKIFGKPKEGKIEACSDMSISATCTRVPVISGHLAVVYVGFRDEKPSLDKIIGIWESFRGIPQKLELPSAPNPPIIYRKEQERPQPRKDRDAGNGMAISSGRLQKSSVLDIRFVGLSHNTVRGAAGGAILTAELLKKQGYF